jgi:hypothetical protein
MNRPGGVADGLLGYGILWGGIKKMYQEGAEMLGLHKPDVEWSMST